MATPANCEASPWRQPTGYASPLARPTWLMKSSQCLCKLHGVLKVSGVSRVVVCSAKTEYIGEHSSGLYPLGCYLG